MVEKTQSVVLIDDIPVNARVPVVKEVRASTSIRLRVAKEPTQGLRKGFPKRRGQISSSSSKQLVLRSLLYDFNYSYCFFWGFVSEFGNYGEFLL